MDLVKFLTEQNGVDINYQGRDGHTGKHLPFRCFRFIFYFLNSGVLFGATHFCPIILAQFHGSAGRKQIIGACGSWEEVSKSGVFLCVLLVRPYPNWRLRLRMRYTLTQDDVTM